MVLTKVVEENLELMFFLGSFADDSILSTLQYICVVACFCFSGTKLCDTQLGNELYI